MNNDKKEIDHILESQYIDCFYHFTHKNNIDSIKKHGLYSLKKINDENIESFVNGNALSRSLDETYGTLNDVHLSFFPNNAMWKRVIRTHLQIQGRNIPYDINYQEISRNEYVLLKIDVSVIHFPGVRISPINAASKEAIYYRNTIRGLKSIDWNNDSSEAEILVPDMIPLEYIDLNNYYWDDELAELFSELDVADYDGLTYLCDGVYIDKNGRMYER